MKIATLALVFAVACTPVLPPEPPPVEPKPGATCLDMCDRLEELQCPEAQDAEDGSSCTKVCEETMANGFDPHPECVVAVKTCAEVSRASQGCDP